MQLETPNMFIYSTDWYGRQTLRMLPVSEACPFNEVIFDPNTNVLAIVSKDKKDKPQMFPKLNDKGQIIPIRGGVSATPNTPQYVEERKILETYYEYYIDNIADMKAFIAIFAVNPEHPAIAIIDQSIAAAELLKQSEATATATAPSTEPATEA